MATARRLLDATRQLRRSVDEMRFATPVTHVYNPLSYAARPHAQYIRRYGEGTKRVVFLGMNPGPFGMAQTGVPFGEVATVRDWLGIESRVDAPPRQNPARPIEGFACRRSEVSGARLWGAIAERFETPERFFRHHFIANYCPLIFMEASGRNRTPDKLTAAERDPLFAACDHYLHRLVDILEPSWVIGVGAFAAGRARQVLGDRAIEIGQILHPSPANPRANRDWAGEVRGQLAALSLCSGG
jgi:single-strand selective monofunctional uracil DNA glycosylase